MYPTDEGDPMNDTNRRRKRPLPNVGFGEPPEIQGHDRWFDPPPSDHGDGRSSYYSNHGTDAFREEYAPTSTAVANDEHQQNRQWSEAVPNPDDTIASHSHRPYPATSHSFDPPPTNQFFSSDTATGPHHGIGYYHADDSGDPTRFTGNHSYYSTIGASEWGVGYDMHRRSHQEHEHHGYAGPTSGPTASYNGMFQHQHMMHHPQAMELGHAAPLYYSFGSMVPGAAPGHLPYSAPFHPGTQYAGQQATSEDSLLELKRRRAKTFPEKLMKALLENPNDDALAWLPDGRSFVIVNPDLFTSEILDKTFKKAKYASFIRKLHRWGFVRLTSGTGTDCFYHPLFTLNDPDQATNINCTPPLDRVGENGEDNQKPSLAGVERFIRAKLAAASAKEVQRKHLSRPREAERVVTQQPDDLSSLSHENDPVQIREVPFTAKQPEGRPEHPATKAQPQSAPSSSSDLVGKEHGGN